MTARASVPVLRALLDEALRRKWPPAVLGVHASSEYTGPRTFIHQNVPVRVEPCVSALAVREAVLSHPPGQWTVVLTDRTDEDLGTGLLSHLVGFRLRTPDPWAGVRDGFAALGIDPALTSVSANRDVATGLLAATPPSRWTPAPGGVLTRDHALGSVAAVHLGLTDPVVDIASVLAWTADPALATRIADLRSLAGDALTDAVLDWAARRAGAAGPTIRHLLRGGEARDAVPLGLIVGLLGQARDDVPVTAAASDGAELARIARESLIRLEARLGGTVPGTDALLSWAAEATTVVAVMDQSSTTRADAGRMLARADQLLAAVHADVLADGSDLLPAGLTRRLATLAGRLRDAAARPGASQPGDPDLPLILAEELHRVEEAWASVAAHRLGESDDRVPAFHAAVRLVRWLSAPSAPGGAGQDDPAGRALSAVVKRTQPTVTLATLVRIHGDHDAWAESAINDAATGVSDPDLGSGLTAVLSVAWRRRAAHDEAFAAMLAAHTRADPGFDAPGSETRTSARRSSGDRIPTRAGVWHVEDLLPRVVLPLAATAPVLLLVLDGMSVGVGTEVMTSILAQTRDDWAEALLPGQQRRATALAVLPTLTEVSRASLLCGTLRSGGQDTERAGFESLTRAHGLVGAVLFHKRPLDSTRPGHAIADDVAAAIADVGGKPLVACVLNTIDDALDRSDPGGTAWEAETIKHLRPLLDRARNTGRVVILTADHGHVIDRRQGTPRMYAGISSTRSRPATPPACDGEILVTGHRVLRHDGTAVLAVDENLRYGPVKAGYHGGGSPAEAIVPVAVLVPGAVPEDADLVLAPPQEPAWWLDPVVAEPVAEAPPSSPAVSTPSTDRTVQRQGTAAVPRKRPDETMATLFDELDADVPAEGRKPRPATAPSATEAIAPEPTGTESRAARVLKSPVYAAQKKIAGRVSVSDQQVGALLSALFAAPGRRLAPAAAATALQVAPVLLRGAVLHVQRLLNVEGYAVLRVDADGATLILDDALLKEQYGI
jgi:hypothetical protein